MFNAVHCEGHIKGKQNRSATTGHNYSDSGTGLTRLTDFLCSEKFGKQMKLNEMGKAEMQCPRDRIHDHRAKDEINVPITRGVFRDKYS